MQKKKKKLRGDAHLLGSSSRPGPAAGRPGRRACPPPTGQRAAWPGWNPEGISPPSLTSAQISLGKDQKAEKYLLL